MLHYLLQQKNININNSKDNGATALYAASAFGHFECVQLLINTPNVNVNATLFCGITPLCVASAVGYFKCVKLLINNPNIDINAADFCGITPLFIASHNGYLEIVQLLLACENINLFKKTTWGETALDTAIYEKKHSNKDTIIYKKLNSIVALLKHALGKISENQIPLSVAQYRNYGSTETF